MTLLALIPLIGWLCGWQQADLGDFETRRVRLLAVVARYLRQPVAWALEQPRSWLAALNRETIDLMERERRVPMSQG